MALLNCPLCEKLFNSKSALNLHHNRHTGYKEFQCEKCENNFIQAINLKTHYISHTEDKPFKCSQCNKPFTRKLTNIQKYMTTEQEIIPLNMFGSFKRTPDESFGDLSRG